MSLKAQLIKACIRHSVGQNIAFARASVTSAEHGHVMVLSQRACDEVGVRRLARASNGDVAHANHRNLRLVRLQKTVVVQPPPKPSHPAENPGERIQ